MPNMSPNIASIDYDALAAALLRAGASGTAAVCAQNGKLAPVDVDTGVEVGSSGDRRSVGSWADAVEEEQRVADGVGDAASVGVSESSGSVEMPGERPSSAGGRKLVFGGLSDGYELPAAQFGAKQPGYFATVVRGPAALALKERVQVLIGEKVPKHAHESLAICAYTAGTMPVAVDHGKQRLRTMASVGDAALTLALCVDEWSRGNTVESVQALRTRITNNKHLSTVLTDAGLGKFVSFAPGVDPVTTVGAATALEAILGVLALHMPSYVVTKFLRAVKLLPDVRQINRR